MTEWITGCPTCGEVNEEIAALQAQLTAAARRETALRTKLAQEMKDGPLMEEIGEVFDHWLAVCRPNAKRKPKLDAKRIGVIRARLKDPWTVEQLKRSIDGWATDDWSMGRDRRTKGATRLSMIERWFADSGSAEQGMDLADQANLPPGTQAPPLPFSWPLSTAVLEQVAYAFHVHHGGSHGLWPLVRPERTNDIRRVFELARANLVHRVEDRRRDWRLTSPREGDARVLPLELRQVLDAFAARGLKTTGRGHQHMGQCPMPDRHAHGDRTPSVSITEMADGATLLNCFGCGAGHRDLRLELGLYDEADCVMTGGVPGRGQMNFAGGVAA